MKLQNNKNTFKPLAIGFSIILFIGGNVISAIFSTNWFEALIISGILIVLALVFWLIIGTIASFFAHPYDADEKNKLIAEVLKTHEGISPCEKEANICCLSRALKNTDIYLEIKKEIKNQFRLYTMQEVYKTERTGFNGNHWGAVWIFSEDLSTEIYENYSAEPVVIANIAHGTEYCMFYLSNNSIENEIDKRKNALLQSLNKNNRSKMQFYPITKDQGYIGKNTLPFLCGSILFGNNPRNNEEMPDFQEGYLSMRRSLSESPIYYKMPRCMLSKYAEYFYDKTKNLGKEQ